MVRTDTTKKSYPFLVVIRSVMGPLASKARMTSRFVFTLSNARSESKWSLETGASSPRPTGLGSGSAPHLDFEHRHTSPEVRAAHLELSDRLAEHRREMYEARLKRMKEERESSPLIVARRRISDLECGLEEALAAWQLASRMPCPGCVASLGKAHEDGCRFFALETLLMKY